MLKNQLRLPPPRHYVRSHAELTWFNFLSNGISSEQRQKRRVNPAFTLAEVLITLGIIGVVAALTIPTLISNHKKHEVEVRLQRAYSTINQAVKSAVVDYGEPKEWELVNAEDTIKKYLIPYISGGKFINESGMSTFTIATITGHSFGANGRNSSGLQLKTGEIIQVSYIYTNYDLPYIDINILLNYKTNKTYIAGKDYFTFIFDINNGKIIPSHALTIKNTTTIIYNCKTQGIDCSTLIMQNGWKIPDNYPVKF